jgi:hypothetical protein
MRSSLFSSIVVAGLLSASAGQVAIAVPPSTAPFQMLPPSQRSVIEPVYYYRGHYYRYRYNGHYYRYRYNGHYYLHRSHRNGHWHYY